MLISNLQLISSNPRRILPPDSSHGDSCLPASLRDPLFWCIWALDLVLIFGSFSNSLCLGLALVPASFFALVFMAISAVLAWILGVSTTLKCSLTLEACYLLLLLGLQGVAACCFACMISTFLDEACLARYFASYPIACFLVALSCLLPHTLACRDSSNRIPVLLKIPALVRGSLRSVRSAF